jgi:hypothetical protein
MALLPFGAKPGLSKAECDVIYVPYTGATADVDLGAHSLTVENITTKTSLLFFNSGILQFYSDEGLTVTGELNSQGSGVYGFNIPGVGDASLDFSGLTDDKTFTFPDKDGTFAMLSDITANVSNDVYGVGWDGVEDVAPSLNAVYDKIETLAGGHDAVTLDANADTLLSLSTQELGLDVQDANKVLAGPTTGGAVVPAFRTLVAGDIPVSLPSLTITESQISDLQTYVLTETDPIVGAITGIVKADGAGAISAATADVDYLTPDTATSTYEPLIGFTPEDAANKDTTTTLGSSNTKYPSQLAVKTYVDTIAGSFTSGLTYKGLLDASGGSYPGSPTQGDYYIISVAGTISGTTYAISDWAAYNGASWDKVDNTQLTVTASLGVQKVGSDLRADFVANDGLKLSTNSLTINYDNSSLGIVSNALAVKALGVTNAMLAGSIADSKLSQITTPSKVSGAAITLLTSLPSGAGKVPVANLGTGTPDGTKYLKDDGTWTTPVGGGGGTPSSTLYMPLYWVAMSESPTTGGAGGTAIWLNMPAAETVFMGNDNKGIRKFDATLATQYRIMVWQFTAGYAGADIRLQYSLNGTTGWTDCNASGELDVGTGTGLKSTLLLDLAAGAQGFVWFRLLGKQGNGAVDPAWSEVKVEFKIPAGGMDGADGGPLADGDYGDITVSSSGAAWAIDSGVVTLAKMADMATASLIYRKTAGNGAPEVNTLATLKTDLGLTGTNSGDQTIASLGIDADITTLTIGANATVTGSNTGDQTISSLGLDADLATLALPANTTISTFGASLIDDAADTNARSTLGLGTIATQAANNVSISGGAVTGITDITLADGGSGASTAELAYNNIADMVSSPASDHTANGPHTNDFAAGASVTVMQLVILNSSSKWVLTDANTASIYSGMVAISLESKTDTQAMNVALPGSIVRDASWSWTPGAPLYISETAGAITATAPTTAAAATRCIGWALAATIIYFFPAGINYITHA